VLGWTAYSVFPNVEVIPIAAFVPKELNAPHSASTINLPSVDPALFGGLCDPNIIGEKQLWNKHKKVLAFAIFNKKEGDELDGWLLDGVQVQSNLAKLYYPDWVIQVYSVGLKDEYIHELISYDNVEVLKCKRLGTPAKIMMHRFLALDNPNVWISVVRDLDSRFSLREMMAVNEWISSPYRFHATRDHKDHLIAIMGGMFGMKRGLLDSSNTTMTAIAKEVLEATYPGVQNIPGCCSDDQNFLTNYIWPKVKHDTLSHDMNIRRCQRFGAKECREFPLGPRNEDTNFFVGAAFKHGSRFPSNSSSYTCTVDCKPSISTLYPFSEMEYCSFISPTCFSENDRRSEHRLQIPQGCSFSSSSRALDYRYMKVCSFENKFVLSFCKKDGSCPVAL